jgi:hypothetical protein
MNLADEIKAETRDWQEWLRVNDDAQHDELIEAAFRAGRQAGIRATNPDAVTEMYAAVLEHVSGLALVCERYEKARFPIVALKLLP